MDVGLRKYVEKIYTDKLTVLRYVEKENDDGTTGEVLDDSKELVGIPCHISALKPDEYDQEHWDVDMVEARVKVYLSPEVRLVKGDEVIADKYLGRTKVVQTYKGKVGDPMVYDLAQEFVLLESRVKSSAS
jgi:hypothetical protein